MSQIMGEKIYSLSCSQLQPPKDYAGTLSLIHRVHQSKFLLCFSKGAGNASAQHSPDLGVNTSTIYFFAIFF